MELIGPLKVSKHDNDVRSKTKARMMEEKKNEGKRVVGLFVRIYRGHSFFFRKRYGSPRPKECHSKSRWTLC